MSAIGVGDLVMVTKACCDAFVRSPVFVVAEIADDPETFKCRHCGQILSFPTWVTEGPNERDYRYPLPWVKKLDPPANNNNEKDIAMKQCAEAGNS